MKLNGKTLTARLDEVTVIPRQDGNLVFKAKMIVDFDPMLKLCPLPNAPEKILPGGEKQFDITHPVYVKALDEWASKKVAWMILESLKATSDLEWETVKANEPDTWLNYEKELQDGGLSATEVNSIINMVLSVCGLDQAKIDEATEAFLAETSN